MSKIGKSIERNQTDGCPKPEKKEREGTANGELLTMTRFFFGVGNMFWDQVVMRNAQPCEYTKNY